LPESTHSVLKKYWGYDTFRPRQEEIIQSVLDKKDTLALLPTGGGKSICYQLPALMQEGICLVISPLIALMRDQVEVLHSKGIRALNVFSGMTSREIDIALDNAAYGGYKFLYLSPERLETELFKARVHKLKVSLIAVDEAHCISEWGYDFRPSYLKIAKIREFFPEAPVIALTASATPRVQKDIQEKLLFKRNAQSFTLSFDRPNLVYAVLEEENKRERLLKLFKSVQGSALVYAYTRHMVKEVAQFLQQHKFSADFYHAGLTPEERKQRQESWKSNKTRIMVCTNAFGMGIDKPDVRLVVHYDMPDNLEAYYQEAGRGGRDSNRSFAIAMSNAHDLSEIEDRISHNHFTAAEIQQVYHALGNYFQIPVGGGEGQSFDFDIAEFAQRYDMAPAKVNNILHELERAGYMAVSESVYLPSRLMVTVDHETLYGFEIAHKKYEPVIKTILRSYGGCFEDYIPINEKLIASRLKMSVKDVIHDLHELQRNQLIDYLPQKSAPQITFVTERLSQKNLYLDHQWLKDRKYIVESKWEAAKKYATLKDRCRGKFILRYFGEEVDKDCGHCDYCLKKKENPAKTAREVRTKLMQALSSGASSIHAVLENMVEYDEKLVVDTIRKMIDEGVIFWQTEEILAVA
jgi:ATP-dependent DNA helicase RecQ